MSQIFLSDNNSITRLEGRCRCFSLQKLIKTEVYVNLRKHSGKKLYEYKPIIFLLEQLLSMSKGFLDHKVFNDPKEGTIHRHNGTIATKDVKHSKLRAHL